MIYLNGGFTGGATRFLTHTHEVLHSLQAKPGMVLCFQHNTYHDGMRCLVAEVETYVVRSGVGKWTEIFDAIRCDVQDTKINL